MTTKPARSATSMASLPHAVANARAALIVSSLAVIGRTTSTSFIVGAGLKKWMPHTWSGRWVAIASSTTGSVDVLVARIAAGLTIWSSSANSARLTARSSTTLSMTRSQSASVPRWSVAATRPSDVVALVRSSFALATCLSRLARTRRPRRRRRPRYRERTTTSNPALAATSARPDPMIPDPTIPTDVISPIGAQLSYPPVTIDPVVALTAATAMVGLRSPWSGTLALLGGGPFVANDDLDRPLLGDGRRRPGRRAADRRRVRGAGALVAAAMSWAERLGVEIEALMVLQRRDAEDAGAAAVVGGCAGGVPRRRLVDAPAQRAEGHGGARCRSPACSRPADWWPRLGPSAAALCDPMLDQRGGAFTLGLGLVTGVAVVTGTETWSAERLHRARQLANTPLVELPDRAGGDAPRRHLVSSWATPSSRRAAVASRPPHVTGRAQRRIGARR